MRKATILEPISDEERMLRTKEILKKPGYGQQKIFILAKRIISMTEDKAKSEGRQITQKEKMTIDELKTKMYQAVLPYAKQEFNRILSKYLVNSDTYQEVESYFAQLFFQALPKYDPIVTTPTTYFKPYIRQAASEYSRSDCQHLKAQDAKNISKVKRAIASFEARGIEYDEEMLITETGLSGKVLRNTLLVSKNSMPANVDDAVNIKANIPTPEESIIATERSEFLERKLREILTPDELHLLDVKIGDLYCHKNKDTTYKQAAEILGITEWDVKTKWSTVICKLKSDPELCRFYGRKERPIRSVNIRQQQIIDMKNDFMACFADADAKKVENPVIPAIS